MEYLHKTSLPRPEQEALRRFFSNPCDCQTGVDLLQELIILPHNYCYMNLE